MRASLDMQLFSYLMLFSSLCPLSSSPSSSCELQAPFKPNRMYKAGDVLLGGLFAFHLASVFPDLTFTQPKEQKPSCSRWVSQIARKRCVLMYRNMIS